MTYRNSIRDISDFLAQKRIAAVGVSKSPRDFTRQLFSCLVERGYDVVPVNPTVDEIDGRRCYKSILDIEPSVSAALLLTPPTATDEVTKQCAARGVPLVWMFRGGGTGAVSDSAVAFCHEHGLRVIAGECPFMFLPDSGLIHRIHGAFRRIAHSYPR